MAIRWDKFTVKAQEGVQRANDIATEHGNPELLPVHLLAALLEDKEGIVPPVLEKLDIGPQAVLNEAYHEIRNLPKVSGEGATQATMSPALTQLIDRAFKEAATSRTTTSRPSTCYLRQPRPSATRPRPSSPTMAQLTTPF